MLNPNRPVDIAQLDRAEQSYRMPELATQRRDRLRVEQLHHRRRRCDSITPRRRARVPLHRLGDDLHPLRHRTLRQKRVALLELIADFKPAKNPQLTRVESIEWTPKQRARLFRASD